MSDEANINPSQKRKRVVIFEDSSSDDSSVEFNHATRRKVTVIRTDSDSDSSVELPRRKRVVRVSSESVDSSDSDIVIKKVKSNKIESESDSSEWESDSDAKPDSKLTSSKVKSGDSSDSNDTQADRCPICLLKFKLQEVGSPEACDHSFCAECIHEWSKSVNTCPVDRKKFNIILVRSSYEGKYLRSIYIDDAANNSFDNEITAEDLDYTPCEVCGSALQEDRLLLCDGCDLGYHMDCLDPPLSVVPEGEWYCSLCNDYANQAADIQIVEFDVVLNRLAENLTRRTPRLIPRTRQTERIRTRIVHQRRQNNDDEYSDGDADSNAVGSSTRTSTRKTTTYKRRATKKRKKYKKSGPKYKITYEIDEKTGEKFAIKKKKPKYKKTKKKKKRCRISTRRVVVPKTVKNRLARQLGIQPPKKAGQSLPDMKVHANPNDIALRRNLAGIPALHLFGQRNELDYFSGSDVEYEASSSVNVRIARRPTISDIALMRRNASKRAIISRTEASSSSTSDILGSILEAQTKLHAKNSIISVARDGTLKIDVDEKYTNPTKDTGASRIRQKPLYPQNTTSSGGTPRFSNSGQYSTDSSYYQHYENTMPTSTAGLPTEVAENNFNRGNPEDENPQDYTVNKECGSGEPEKDSENKKRKSAGSDRNTPLSNSDSELDIYSDIETGSTHKYDECDMRCPSPPIISSHLPDDEDNESDTDLIIDTEKPDSDKYDPAAVFESDDDKENFVTSTSETQKPDSSFDEGYSPELQLEIIQTSTQASSTLLHDDQEDCYEAEDDCPNFSIYSSESINLAKNTDLSVFGSSNQLSDLPQSIENNQNNAEDENNKDINLPEPEPNRVASPILFKNQSTLYSDSEDESFMKLNPQKPFGIGDIQSMTEDISEEERSYTPCLDEVEESVKEGLEGLDTEMISDDDKNDFEETPDLEDELQAQLQTIIADSDALEINAKESELDFSKPDDGEDGEITGKSKSIDCDDMLRDMEDTIQSPPIVDNEIEAVFKRISKSNKVRNYRDKNKEKSKSIEKQTVEDRRGKKEKRRERRTEIALYDVRSVVESRPKRDKFGRDPTIRQRSVSSEKSQTPPRRISRDDDISRPAIRQSPSPVPIRMAREPIRLRSISISSRSRTPPLRHSPSQPRGRKSRSPIIYVRNVPRSRSLSKSHQKRSRSLPKTRNAPGCDPDMHRRKSGKPKGRKRNKSVREKTRSRSPVQFRRRPWKHQRLRAWTPSISRSVTPEFRHMTPSWTPPRNMDSAVRPRNLTVTLPNNKKKKDKRRRKPDKRSDKRSDRPNKRRRKRSSRPAKEVFTSGNNILVSVSFNKENEVRSRRLRNADLPTTRRVTRENGAHNRSRTPKRRRQRVATNIKPIAIIDLERSPFRIITPPNEVIILSDSEAGDDNNDMDLPNTTHRDTSAHVASPEPVINNSYVNGTGPKTPPEPQVKFTFTSKPTQLRAITNPLLEADEVEEEIDPQEELENRLNEVMHKGPNTPPEPPISPPSSPDAYDPFEPTKSRSPTPDGVHHSQSNISKENSHEEVNESLTIDLSESSVAPAVRSHTPPLNNLNLQPVDPQNSIRVTTPDSNRVASPERSIAVVINQIVQTPIISKAIPPTFSSGPSSMITSTPISTNLAAPRINILNSTFIPQSAVTSIPQRIVLPNTTKSSPVNKVSPSKTPVKLTPIKPMPSKNPPKPTAWKIKVPEPSLDLTSPYSPGSSDYDGIFDPPAEILKPIKAIQPAKNSKAPVKSQNAFDNLFGLSPGYKNKNKRKIPKRSQRSSKGTKMVGVKLDEDNLKILDELPNSAVEMLVKDKFLKKLNRQERVVEEVKVVLKPYYNKKRVNKEEYKDILRRAVPKICHNKSGEINPKKIQKLIVAYVRKLKHANSKKVPSSGNVQTHNTQSQKTEAVSNWLSKLN